MNFNKLFNQVKSLLNKNKTYTILFFLNLISAFGAILIYRFIAESFGSKDTFVFTYLKRIISLIVPISLFGLGVTLTRRVAIDPERSYGYMLISLVTTILLPLLLLVFYYMDPEYLTLLFWGEYSITYKKMFFPLIMNIVGVNFTLILVSFYRGKGEYVKATLINLLLIVVLPILILSLNLNFRTYILTYGITLILITILISIPRNTILEKKNYKDFLVEGFSRVFGDISYYFLLFSPSYFVLILTNDISLSASIAFCQVIINASSILINPISFMALTKTAEQASVSNTVELKKEFFKTIKYIFVVFFISYFLVISLLKTIINYFYTDKVLENLEDIKFFLIVLPFIAIYMTSRSYVDGITKKAIMSYINFIGLFLFLFLLKLFISFFEIVPSISGAFILSFFTMDVLILMFMRRVK
jgi:O-antigen/teichoic acid export membrane protein